MAVVLDCAWGATAVTPAIWWAIASTSSGLKFAGWGPPPPRPKPWPGRTWRMLVPSDEIDFCTAAGVAWPSVTIVTTAATPMMMPSVVRNERSLWRRIDRIARRKVVPSIILLPLPLGGGGRGVGSRYSRADR